ncbi:flagellar export chaperone FliS [Mobiluncus mulieris]|uniref:Flagellar secretion chaperone FliS n=2 Tax=Mobiluncus mulieris TaxID=2052 RepID=E0QNN2_9ACTO|nr:flagellar export chaperone FliS [Mobiluncus mulieris]EEJ52831.1 flagellar protein FliS [Mobiluncus mulieris ATCC 35243]EFM46778.1 flagellar protein FliS [Mobiluncus mulieris ATCC 35239]MCU9968014.1 flagellar export chaperone FliS [Mobiluncus mulieris]MCU9970668.1 flagellar export chaperone FliS [Mobiluncus mulieris]MCU9972932.1 flagellar export chaperone FliS [Mobiluncus mulieris]
MQTAINRFQQDSIVTASPARLLTMLYDRLLLDLGRAENALAGKNRVEAHKNLTHAQDIIAELMSSLRMDVWDGAEGLMALYVYAMKELVNANVNQDATKAREIHELFKPLADAWKQAAAQLEAEEARSKASGKSGEVKRTASGDLGVG